MIMVVLLCCKMDELAMVLCLGFWVCMLLDVLYVAMIVKLHSTDWYTCALKLVNTGQDCQGCTRSH